MPLRFFETAEDPALAGFMQPHTVGVLPVAATEPHGPHLPVSTDCDIARGHLQALDGHLDEHQAVAVLPLQTIGYSIEHAAFAGLRNREPEQLLADWGAVAEAFHRAGGRRLVIVSSHGGNSPVVDLLIRRLRVQYAMLAVGTGWMRFGQPDGLFDADELAFGMHGGAVETSLMLHYAPQAVDMKSARAFPSAFAALGAEFAYLSAFGPHRFGWMSQDFNAAGVAGDAGSATADKGAASARHALAGFAALLAEVAAFDLNRLPAAERAVR